MPQDCRTKIVVPGGSGFVGRTLAPHLAARGIELVILSRRPGAAVAGTRTVPWDGEHIGPWARELDGADAVINLAGRSVDCRYHARNRRVIRESRLRSTRVIGEAIARSGAPPRVWLNASTATIYRHALDRDMDERTGAYGEDFSVSVARAWEKALDADTPHTRRVALRSSLILGPEPGGVYRVLRRLVRLGLGGTLGAGNQYVSWIHARDWLEAVDFLLARDDLDGVVNVTAPHPVQNHEFMASFRRACRMQVGLPATKWMLEVGAVFLRTETELVLKSRRVVPRRLLEAGLRFRFPEVVAALEDLARTRPPRPLGAFARARREPEPVTRDATVEGTLTARGEEKRAAILAAALDLFRDRGYEKTTMRAVAERAGVAVGGAYYYFPSKESLVQDFYRRLVEAHSARSDEVLAQHRSLRERLRHVVHAKLDLAAPYHPFATVLFRTAANPDSPLNPFSAASRSTRERSLAIFRELVRGSRDPIPADLSEVLPKLLWLYQMGVILHWIHDRSEHAARTRRLVDLTVDLAAKSLAVMRLPGAGGVRRLVVRSMHELAPNA